MCHRGAILIIRSEMNPVIVPFSKLNPEPFLLLSMLLEYLQP